MLKIENLEVTTDNKKILKNFITIYVLLQDYNNVVAKSYQLMSKLIWT